MTFDVVIVGGGYAGVIASNRFWASLSDAGVPRAARLGRVSP